MGSDAGISAGLAAREQDPTAAVSLLVADTDPNFSICGIPYHISGDVPDWRHLAHRTADDPHAAWLELQLGHRVISINPYEHTVKTDATTHDYDKLVIGTGALPATPHIHGLDRLGRTDGLLAAG